MMIAAGSVWTACRNAHVLACKIWKNVANYNPGRIFLLEFWC